MLRWLILGTFLLAGALCFWKSNLLSHFDQPAVASIHSAALPDTAQPSIAYELRSVADFKASDPILAFNHETGEVETRYVKRAFERLSDHLRILTFISEDGQKQTIKTTNEHPFWVVEHDDYVEAGDLQMGYKVRGPTGELLWLLSTRYEPHPEGVPVYNCEVADLHNYFVTPRGSRAPPLLAHNTCAPNGGQNVTVLGRYKGGTERFIGKPGFNVLNVPSRGPGRWNWTRNKRFIDNAIKRGDEIRLVTNPYAPIYSGGNVFQRELTYLKHRGYKFMESGDYWIAVLRR